MLPDGTLPDDYVVLDLETTGVSWYRDTIIEFGAVKVVDRKPVSSWSIRCATSIHSSRS